MFRFYTTCPPSSGYGADTYAARVRQVARWSEESGAEGALIYTDNSLADPWAVAQAMIGATERLVPLVAVQPLYVPPYAVAKTIASLAMLHGRAVALNMVAGGFVRDLAALGDATPHDDRYARLEEYTALVLALLRGGPVSAGGRCGTLAEVTLAPALPAALLPRVFVSGSSEAGAVAAAALGATPVSYPPPPDRIGPPVRPGSFARLGVVARATAAEAWTIARARFPKDPRGRMAHALATATSDSAWLRRLAEIGAELERTPEEQPYWLHPLQTYKTFCPYLVGSHGEVAGVLARYRALGFEGVILDVPATVEDLPNTMEAFRLAAPAPAMAEA